MCEMEAAAKDLVESIGRLSTDPSQTHDETLRTMCALSRTTEEELLAAVGEVQEDTKGSKWKKVSRAPRVLRIESKARDFQVRLTNLRLQIATHFVIESQYVNTFAQ